MLARAFPRIALSCALLLCLTAASAAQGIPDLGPSFATVNPEGSDAMIVPSGTAASLADQDVVIDVWVLDFLENPIPGYPFQDVWLDGFVPVEISVCQNGSVADANTDVEGHTTISGAIAGGGWTQQGAQVYLAGVPLDRPALALDLNSPDINADLIVDLADFGIFAQDFLSMAYHYRSDFNHDGLLDLTDVGEFAFYVGDGCP